jgi:hypothetical protein
MCNNNNTTTTTLSNQTSCPKKRDTRLQVKTNVTKKGKGKKKRRDEKKGAVQKKRKYTSSRSPMDIRFSNCY